jgi:hypothetical protein
MPEKALIPQAAAVAAGGADKHSIKEAVCVHTQKIYDACRDKDCLEDLRVYFTNEGQAMIDCAVSIKCHKAELIWCCIDVESVAFNRGFYSVDVGYYYLVTLDVSMGAGRPVKVFGLATFDKRVILFGSEGNAKIFTSTSDPDNKTIAHKAHMPTAVVEAVDPICLSVKVVERHHKPRETFGNELRDVPAFVSEYFEEDLLLGGGEKCVYCTLGQFSIIRLERDTQLVMPCYDFCMPEKECIGGSDDNPCDLFKRIKFPVDEFFPPVAGDYTDYRELRDSLCK